MKITELFERGEFVVSAEVGPPKGFHVEQQLANAKKYLSGVAAVNVTDNQSSVMRLGSLAMCKALQDEGITPVFQLACRDRNRIALQSDLLSAAMFGIENLLLLTGDHTQLAKMERKVRAGADYFQTQAVFEPEKFIRFMEKAKQFGKPVQVGIIIPKSAGMAKFMNNNVAGIHVPEEMIEELAADKEKAKAGITGVEIAARIIKECRPYCQGIHIMALGWEDKVPELLKQAGI